MSLSRYQLTEMLSRYTSEQMLSILTKIAITAGTLSLTGTLYSILHALYRRLSPSQLSRYQHPDRHNKATADPRAWALITGASDGIGLQFAHSLAARGFNIVLHGRNETKLHKIATLLESTYRISTRLLILDASTYQPTPSSHDTFTSTIHSTLSSLNLTILINNVGGITMISPQRQIYSHHTAPEIDLLINTNLRFPAQLTRAVLPFLERNQPGLIINVSSGAALEPGAPWEVVYAAAKAFNSRFSTTLKTEFRAEGVDIESLALEILFTATPGLRGDSETKETFLLPHPRKVVESALGLVGKGYATVTPYWAHAVQRSVLWGVGGWWPGWLGGVMIEEFGREKRLEEEKLRLRREKEGDGGEKTT